MQGERFSFVEIGAIIVVLFISAASFSPRFTKADVRQRDISQLIDALETVRSGLDLYRIEHEGCLPSTDSFEGFKNEMCGKISRVQPYIKKMPINPFSKTATVRFDGEPAGANKAGWRFDTKSGLFQADNDAACAAL